MNKIILAKPVVLKKSLEDMAPEQKEIAYNFLANKMLLIRGENGFKFVDVLAPRSESGNVLLEAEAVCFYRNTLGLPDVSIRIIDMDDIIPRIHDHDTLLDILDFARDVDLRNNRLKRLLELEAPEIIIANEYSLLWMTVEGLQDNSKFISYEDELDEEMEEEGELCKALADIGYDLVEEQRKYRKEEIIQF